MRILPDLRLASVLIAAALALAFAGPLAAQIHPNHAQGFEPQKAYELGEIEHINLFNGNLNLTIPLGESYPVDGGFSYGLTLTYSGNVWEWEEDYRPCTDEWLHLLKAVPRRRSNAGLGWRLTMGHLDPDRSPLSRNGLLAYESPDGALRTLHYRLHPNGGSGSSGHRFSQDGSYLRYGVNAREMEMPDGTTQMFDGAGRVTRIRDRFGNDVEVDYSTPNLWVLTDKHGRTQRVYFQSAPHYGSVVDRVELTAFGGATATYRFEYENHGTVRGYTEQFALTDCDVPRKINLPFLKRIIQPDGSEYSMDYDYGPGAQTSTLSGHIVGMTLPVGGRMEWDWTLRTFPQATGERVPLKASTKDRLRAIAQNPFRYSAAVGARRHETVSGSSAGTWTYTPQLDASGTRPLDLTVTVENPANHRTKHYFSTYFDDMENVTPEPSGWYEEDYGLPFTRYTSDGAGRYLSREIYHQGTSLKRKLYLRYERDGATAANPRVASERTTYVDDGNRWASVDRSDFDGVGHYRRVTTDGDFGGDDYRQTYTDYHDGQCASCQPGGNVPWILGLYTYQTVTDGTETAKTEACFDGATGFLLRTRRLAYGTERSDRDVIVRRTKNGAGNLTKEEIFGGDTQSVSRAGLCGLPLPAAQYETDYTYGSGSLRTATPVGAGFRTTDRDIDSRTGKVLRSRDTAGLSTTYEYDAMGRLTYVKPGDDGWTQYVYGNASGSTPAKLYIHRKPNGGGSALASEELHFDGFGRVRTERRKMPDDMWSERDTVHTALGWLSSREEWNRSERTYYLGYDPFGRPAKIQPPDGSHHNVDFTYKGDRVVERTVRIGTGRDASTGAIVETVSKTTEIYDRQGRLRQVKEPANADGTDATATYSYDVGGRLAQVSHHAKASSGATPTQVRQFDYDQRGFLRSETHPEKATVTYQQYDARGNVGRVQDGPNDLYFTYDATGRVRMIQESVGGVQRPVKEFIYASSNGSGDHREGKLRKALRWNYPVLYGNEYTALVTETYTYGGRQGRVSDRETTLTFNGATTERFFQGWTYDELGQVEDLEYPRCQFSFCNDLGPVRTVSHGRTEGRLTSIPGYISDIDYHANGMWSRIDRTNGTYDQQNLAGHGMARPRLSFTRRASDSALVWSSGYYTYDGAGNVTKMGQSYYLYDAVSRVTSGVQRIYHGGGGAQRPFQFTYDGFGNMTYASTGTARNVPTSGTTNRLTGGNYDGAGNLTSWNGAAYEYDAVGMLKRYVNGSQAWLYMYTADDERLWSFQEGANPRFDRFTLRDLGGKVLRTWEASNYNWTWTEDHVYRDGTLLASEEPSGRTHLHPDHLGTPRGISNSAGQRTAYHAYYPFGEEATSIHTDDQRMKFTGHERDFADASSAADDLDYMHARYYSPLNGRFLSVDPARSAELVKPQSWNRYSYAFNSPLQYTDPDGLKARVYREGEQVLIEIPVTFSGPEATPERTAQFREAVESTWSGSFGQYEVTTRVIEEDMKGANRVKFSSKEGRSKVWGDSYAVIYKEENQIPSRRDGVDAHEAGHLMKSRDRYKRNTSRPKKGWEGNIMAQTNGVVTEANIKEVLKRNKVLPLPEAKKKERE